MVSRSNGMKPSDLSGHTKTFNYESGLFINNTNNHPILDDVMYLKKNKIMKKIIAVCFILLAFVQTKAQSSTDNWPALKALHSIMSATFHPSEEGNLKPIKERSKELVQKAKELALSKAPLEFNKPAIKKAVADLVSGAEKLDKMIADKAIDADIIKALSGLHDVFHQIVGLCKNPENEKH